MTLHVLASAPGSPVLAQMWFNSTTGGVFIKLAGSSIDLANPLQLNSQNGAYYLARANHSGTQLAATISDFNAAVRLNTLSQLAVPTADVALGGFKITGLAAPVSGTDAATKAYADSLVVGLVDDRGNYDASVNTFPAAGGSGTAGAILKGDLWYISIAGTLGGAAVSVGDSVRALSDTPGQTAANWDILSHNIGFVPENVSNKDTDSTMVANSDTKYASQKAVKTALAGKQASLGYTPLRKYGPVLIGNGVLTSFATTQATHLCASDVSNMGGVYDAATGARMGACDPTVNPANGTVTFTFAVAPTTNQFYIVIWG